MREKKELHKAIRDGKERIWNSLKDGNVYLKVQLVALKEKTHKRTDKSRQK